MRTIKSIRLPRKLKKDVIKVCGRENYYKMIMMRLRYIKTGEFVTKIKKGNG
jgi:hypothetical protein